MRKFPNVLLYVFFFFLAATLALGQQKRLGDGEIASRMFSATKAHNYDEAIRIGLERLAEKPSDGPILSQMAIVYLQEAAYDEKNREKWLKLAAEYGGKTFTADPDDVWNVNNAARAYELVGDVSAEKKCMYYARSLEIFGEMAAKAETNQDSHDLKTAKDATSRVQQKAMQARCK